MSTPEPAPRKIIHIDMDCFYAAIEARDNAALRGKPIAVGGDGMRSVVCTASYEARQFGVRSAMPMMRAKTECPGLIIVPPRFEAYKAESLKIRAIFADYTELIEPLSLDEAYLDVSHSPRYASALAKEIRQRIFQETALTASAGIAPNKMLAKIASDWKKPNGQFTVTPDQVDAFIAPLPIRKIPGIGPVSAEQLRKLGAETCADLQALDMSELIRRFGSSSYWLHQRCRGLDDRPVEANTARKSLSTERTFSEDLTSLEACRTMVYELHDELLKDLIKAEDRAIHKLVVKVKFADFQQTTKECVQATPDLHVYQNLLEEAYARSEEPVRLLGVGVKFYDEEKYQQLLLKL
ncbi:DNA polymerase IV [Cerasicoccus maritimus]|uniref:DNA polymerase IV n=1 Tax=Cerasicoccus maritimus TaxID=490089 RepID=UPI0028528537|nr:DNA polymerase IV [Cerasicoccus maritimus]